MTSIFGNDPFFDSDGDQEKEEPFTLKGEYHRDVTPPSQLTKSPQDDKPSPGNSKAGQHNPLYSQSSTSGNFSAESDTMSHKRDSSGSYYGRSRSRSRSPAYSRSRSRSPSHSRSKSRTPTYSDSFDSEDSLQDSRRASPVKNRKSTRRSPATTSRYSSGASKDSRSTYRTYGVSSSGYGAKSTKPNFKKGAQKKKGAGRSQSVNTLQQSPRSNEVARRMLSAKGHTINKLRSDFDDLRRKYDDVIRENKLMKQLQRRQEAALAKFEDKDEELPQLLRSHAAEVDNLRERLRRTQDREKDKDRRIKDKNEELNKLNDELKKLRHLADNKRLLERDKLQRKVDRLQDDFDEKERRVNELEKHIENVKKNTRHDTEQWKQREREYRARVAHLEEENQTMKYQLKEKEKELEIRNIYSNRVMKPPGKLDHSPRPLAQTRATSNDDIKSTKPPPPAVKRSSSAEEKRKIDRTPREPKEEPKPVEKKETPRKEEKKKEVKKELSEHDKILMDLDAGFKPKPPPSKEDNDILRDLDNDIKKRERLDEEKARAEERRKREKEEEERKQKAEEEERRRLQKEEEEKKRKEEERKERERKKEEEDRRKEEEDLAAQRKKQKEESERLAEERRKKDLLLAKMREIDSKPESRGSKKEYKFTEPIQNLHNGKPSHPDLVGSPKSSPKKIPAAESDATFGGYAPSFGRRAGGDKPPIKKGGLFDDDDDSDDFFSTKPKPAEKSNPFADSSKSSTPNKGRNSFEGSIFSTSTKAKPVADSATLPWEKKTQPGSLFNQSNKPNGFTVNVPKTSFDDFDDDIEEVIL